MKRKKLLTIFIGLLMITATSVLGYSTISYVMNKTIDQSAQVGDTVIYTDGLIIELASFDNYTLTFFDIEESATQKHYLTYTYNYEILVDGMDMEVSSVGDDIIVSEFIVTDTQISITFCLNQEKTFNNGDLINIQFYFEGVENVGLNINTATYDELIIIGFTDTEATEIVALTYDVTNLADLYTNVFIMDAITRFEPLVNDGTIVFE
jgi:hypothetical protein